MIAERTNKDAVSVAQAVEPSMISLPTVAGSLRLVDVLPPKKAKVSRDLRVLELPPELLQEITVRPCHRITPDGEVDVARKLLQAGMCELIEEDRIYRHPTTGKLMTSQASSGS